VRTAGRPKRGVKRRFLGSVLVFTGLLNAMLALKGGLVPDRFNYMLILAGGALFASGVWRDR